LILLIVFSLSDANINRRNFARSYLIGLAVAIVLTIVLVLTGTLARAMNSMDAEYIQNLLKSMPKA
jgi:heme/copper-type cytochrome/quinol oxidase subunit 4